MRKAQAAAEKLWDINEENLIATYRGVEGEDKAAAGREIMGRILVRVELSDLSTEPLRRRDGTTFTSAKGQPLRVVDYLEVAGQHGPAEDILLNFVVMPEADEKFQSSKEALASMIKMYAMPAQESGAAT